MPVRFPLEAGRFTDKLKESFDHTYMYRLFALGHEIALTDSLSPSRVSNRISDNICSEDRCQFSLLTGQWNFLDVSHSGLSVAPVLLACRTSGKEE